MIDRQGSLRRFVMREGAEWDRRPGGGLDVEIVERVGALLEFRIDLHDDVVLVDALVHRGDLPLSESVIERIIDRRWR